MTDRPLTDRFAAVDIRQCLPHLALPDLSRADPVLIGLTGRARSGKSTAAQYLVDRHDFEADAFAQPIKDTLADLMTQRGADYAHLHEPQLKQQPIPQMHGTTARFLMQSLGDWGRGVHPDFWIQQLAHRIGLPHFPRSTWAPVHHRIVISDVRFPDEAWWIISRGGIIIRLHRDEAGPAMAHASEQHIDTLPAHIDLVNNGPTHVGLHALLDGALRSASLVDA